MTVSRENYNNNKIDMGKTKKMKSSRTSGEKGLSLADQVIEDRNVRATGRVKVKRNKEEVDEYVDDKLSRKILEQARLQQEELEEEHGTIRSTEKGRRVRAGHGPAASSGSSDLRLGRGAVGGSGSESEDSEEEHEEFYENIVVAEEDEKALSMFMSQIPPTRRTLADIIQEKITEKQTEIQSQMTDNASLQMQELDERVVNMYRSIKQVLQKYRSGKLPKAFKIVPSLRNWEQILYLTEPDTWSAAAMYQATRIFASNLNAKMAQRCPHDHPSQNLIKVLKVLKLEFLDISHDDSIFICEKFTTLRHLPWLGQGHVLTVLRTKLTLRFFNLVLLPRIRDDISEYKRLNFHLYMAVRKSLFKPAAFFKGILLPLCEAGNCTLREAVILASILSKNSIPMLHSAAALLKIAEMDYNGANSIFMRTLLDKKYALPFRVVDAIVFHFQRFMSDKRELPVLWHQCLLTFVQRYKADVSTEQKELLMNLLRVHSHPKITPEVRRELVNSTCRDVEDGMGAGMDIWDD